MLGSVKRSAPEYMVVDDGQHFGFCTVEEEGVTREGNLHMVMIILAAIKADGKAGLDTAMPHISNTLRLSSILSRNMSVGGFESRMSTTHIDLARSRQSFEPNRWGAGVVRCHDDAAQMVKNHTHHWKKRISLAKLLMHGRAEQQIG